MNIFEEMKWKKGKENEFFLKKGPEKLFYETLKKSDKKYIKIFKDIFKYIDRNCIVSFFPELDCSNKEITKKDIENELETNGTVLLLQIIKTSSKARKNSEFQQNIDDDFSCFKNFSKVIYVSINKNLGLNFSFNKIRYIGFSKKSGQFAINEEIKLRTNILINSHNVFQTECISFLYFPYKEKEYFDFKSFKELDVAAFVLIELAKYENYFFKDFSKEMKEYLEKGMTIESFFQKFKFKGNIGELKDIGSKKEYFLKLEKIRDWNKYNNKLPFILNYKMLEDNFLFSCNENVLRKTLENKDKILEMIIFLSDAYRLERFMFGIAFILINIIVKEDKLIDMINLCIDTFNLAIDLEIQIDLSKIKSYNSLQRKHDALSREFNLRARLKAKEKLETVFEFPEKFQLLIKNIDKKYELIKDGERLLCEGEEQRNCVFSYFKNITEGKCLIYSLLTETEKSSEDISGNSAKRYTIEIIERDDKFEVVQFLGKFNKKTSASMKLESELREKLKDIRTKKGSI